MVTMMIEPFPLLLSDAFSRRSVLKIGSNEPSTLAIDENATVLARYASICQVGI